MGEAKAKVAIASDSDGSADFWDSQGHPGHPTRIMVNWGDKHFEQGGAPQLEIDL